MAEVVYILCTATSILCAVLLFRSYRASRTRLLFWSSLCFMGLAVNNVMLILDLYVVSMDLFYARTLVAKQDWRFEVAKGLTIPEQDRQADIVCFFSVLTHLLHEESYLYLLEAKRVLKPGGKIVASFLDFKIDAHWSVFEDNLKDVGIGEKPLNVFMSADLMQKWAKHLDLEVEAIKDGDEKHILLSQPITFSSGETVEGTSAFGQSLCVLVRKP